MRLTVGLALTLAIMTCGAQVRDMQSIEHSGELKVGVPGDYAPLAFRNAAGELQGYDVGHGPRSRAHARPQGELRLHQLARARRRSAGGQV
ncbi:putative ABC-type amino acid transport/signal transduction systems periplasmic component [Klebsiella pneumoniae]|uniref:Putative ABC-type amino acid transport/signal transduction systems periplasmic component n=1 Tax=Klebsiella pneumoniae TaxID=573 RepID=A0A2X3ISV9_KLEPN|nr:putative ABC-type amino acid transport/signal transduction systems periplasmic component [Klebsiella pneumoniae]